MIVPAVVHGYTVLIPNYEEVIGEQYWVRHPPDSFQVIQNIRFVVDGAMDEIPDVYSNPVVTRVMETNRQ